MTSDLSGERLPTPQEIIRAREQAGLTQEQAAEAAWVPVELWRDYESGKKPIRSFVWESFNDCKSLKRTTGWMYQGYAVWREYGLERTELVSFNFYEEHAIRAVRAAIRKGAKFGCIKQCFDTIAYVSKSAVFRVVSINPPPAG